jgi:hypothetical protein
MKWLCVLTIVALAGLYRLGSAAEPAIGGVDWRADLLDGVGNTAPTADMLHFLESWHQAEGGSAAYNPLNTTQDAPGASCYNVINGRCGVKNYPDYQTGIDATITTLRSDYPGYAEIVAGMQTNDVERALNGIAQSPWGTHAGLIADVYSEQSAAPQTEMAGAVASTPIDLGGDCGWNVAAALSANGGALQQVTLAPGETFSFNATMGDPDAAGYRSCAGVPGGNWCNLAARYSQVARALGLAPQFLHHGVNLGAGIENDVLIWNIGGVPGFEGGRQDLIITNTLDRAVTFQANVDGGSVTITGTYENAGDA